jgi:drug/metabolite transporter (DMT)-like permease
MPESRSSPTLLLLCFAAVYLIWGFSFAASKLVVGDLPPLLASGVRFTIAGIGLALIAAWRGAPLPRAPGEWRHFAIMALFLIVLSNGFNTLALRYVASSESALLNVSSAFWIPLLGAIGARGHPVRGRAALGLLLGFAGVSFLMWPRGGLSSNALGWKLLIVAGCFAWALGTLYYRRITTTTPALMFSAIEMLIGGLALALIGLINGDAAHWHATWPSLGGLAFLTVMSSGVAYTSFGYLMRHTTPARLGTYGYVNPAVAALVGWLLLGERLSAPQLVGTAIALGGVVLISLPVSGETRVADAAAPPSEATP